ncbi:MAG TPA: transposase [Burkholderiaceae bacterium]|nr:transposase [Burkholderiaceae bacterium]
MARLPRLTVPGYAHLILLRGHNGESVFRDDADRRAFLEALDSALNRDQVALHGYALQQDRVWLLCTPRQEGQLSHAMQSLGRRFSAAFNRKHDRSGSLWDGRYRSTVVEPGATLLDTLIFVDQAPSDRVFAESPDAPSWTWSSARQHLGFEGPVPLSDIAEYWALGNTPFDRAAVYRARLNESIPSDARQRTVTAVLKARPLGSDRFVEDLQKGIARRLTPRPRGRPRKHI